MRIVVDVSPLSHTRTGIGNYIRGSVAGLVEASAGRHEIVGFAPTSMRGPARIREALAGLDVELRLWPLPWSHGVRTAWSALPVPAVERLAGPLDVFHFSDWMAPPQRSGLRATTIHDLVPLRFPEWVTVRTRAMHRRTCHAAEGCDVVVVNSAYTGRDVLERLCVPEERIRVAYPGVAEVFRADGERADLGEPYVLTVATLEPRKNLGTLVRAHAAVKDDLLLAVVGGQGWGDEPHLGSPRIVRLGYVTDIELARLYRGAAAVVYPSRFEGFGMPIVEAMACGAPVVASAHPSMDEASGDAAVRVDPDDPDAIADGIRGALAGREALVRRGVEHAARFSWRATGEALLAAYGAAS